MPAATSVPLFIESYQRRAWSKTSFASRVDDSTFVYSGRFVPPPDFERDLIVTMASTGRAVLGTIITAEVLTNSFQEKITPPFLFAAWDRLQHKGQLKADLVLGKNVHLATAPTRMIYPEVLPESTGQYGVIFDPGLFFVYLLAANAIAAIGVQIGLDEDSPNRPGFNLGNIVRLGTPLILHNRWDAIQPLAESLANIVVSGSPIPGTFVSAATPRALAIVGQVVDEVYTFILAHELNHIQHGHFDRERGRISEEEFTADFLALGMLVNSSATPSDNFASYICAGIAYHIMSYLYRTVHLLSFRRDYGHLPGKVQYHLYFQDREGYSHPLKRLHDLRKAVRHHQISIPANLDEYDKHIDEFFEMLWKPICVIIMQMQGPVADLWSDVVRHHALAYQDAGYQP